MLEFIVEDDARLRQASERILLIAGYDAKWYNSAEAVVNVAAAWMADCLNLDIQLPRMAGFEFFRTLARGAGTAKRIYYRARRTESPR
jgi:FixJ family two-component response regulator